MSEIHGTAAEGFDKAAEVYERARPGYPAAACDWLVAHLNVAPGDLVVDLAAGTGKLTKELVERGLHVVAVEPVEGMRAQLACVVPGVRALDGTAEAMPLRDGEAAAVTVAQAFHWFRVDEALAELHRVLRAGGRLALVWNVRDERVDWVQRITEIIDPYAQGSGVGIPRFRNRDWQPALDRTPGFVRVAEEAFPWEQPMDADGLVARIESTSFISVLPAERKVVVLDEIRELARAHPDLRGRANFGFPYVTEVTVFEATVFEVTVFEAATRT